jgi:hypothetical protein
MLRWVRVSVLQHATSASPPRDQPTGPAWRTQYRPPEIGELDTRLGTSDSHEAGQCSAGMPPAISPDPHILRGMTADPTYPAGPGRVEANPRAVRAGLSGTDRALFGAAYHE